MTNQTQTNIKTAITLFKSLKDELGVGRDALQKENIDFPVLMTTAQRSRDDEIIQKALDLFGAIGRDPKLKLDVESKDSPFSNIYVEHVASDGSYKIHFTIKPEFVETYYQPVVDEIQQGFDKIKRKIAKAIAEGSPDSLADSIFHPDNWATLDSGKYKNIPQAYDSALRDINPKEYLEYERAGFPFSSLEKSKHIANDADFIHALGHLENTQHGFGRFANRIASAFRHGMVNNPTFGSYVQEQLGAAK